MARYYGQIGFGEEVKIRKGVSEVQIVERSYYGDIHRNTRRYQAGSGLNDDLNISNEISIVADPYAFENFHHIRYITWMGIRWKVTNISVQYPRLVLTIGGEFNGSQTTTAGGA